MGLPRAYSRDPVTIDLCRPSICIRWGSVHSVLVGGVASAGLACTLHSERVQLRNIEDYRQCLALQCAFSAAKL